MTDDLSPEDRRAVDDYLGLTKEERESLMDFARFADRPSKADADVKNLEALKEIVREKPKLVAIMQRAELWAMMSRYLLMGGGIAGVIITFLTLYKTLKGA